MYPALPSRIMPSILDDMMVIGETRYIMLHWQNLEQ